MLVLKDHGGNVLTVMKYFIQQLCVCVMDVIRSLVTAGSARMNCSDCGNYCEYEFSDLICPHGCEEE